MAEVERYCRCGDTLRGTANPTQLATELEAGFDTLHAGAGHGPATPQQAARARRREQRAAITEELTR